MANNPKPIPNLNWSTITDPGTRRCMQNLDTFFKTLQPGLLGLQHMELVFTQATDHFQVKHGLGYIPLDIILTRLTGAGNVAFNYSAFDENNLDISVSGACRVRFLFGTITSQATNNTQATETQTYQPGG